MLGRAFCYVYALVLLYTYVRSSRHNAMSSSLDNNGSLHSLLTWVV